MFQKVFEYAGPHKKGALRSHSGGAGQCFDGRPALCPGLSGDRSAGHGNGN